MKVLLLNGSPHAKGNTAAALEEMIPIFQEAGIETELVQVGHLPIRGCIGCQSCYRTGKCAIDDIVNELAVKLQEADGLVVGSPVYLRQLHPHRRAGPAVLQHPVPQDHEGGCQHRRCPPGRLLRHL